MSNENSIEGFIDTHIHTAPDIKPRALNDIEEAIDAKNEKMQAIVLKSHVESTASRAKIAETVTGFKVIGGICLNSSVGGLNLEAVKVMATLGGKIVWFPTISAPNIDINHGNTEEILSIIAENDLILGTGHLKPYQIFLLLDHARSSDINKIIINHPLTGVVGASIDEQKEMSRYAYLEHCFVACMERHDNLDPQIMANAIKEIGPKRCIMATDFGQAHNPKPVEGMKMFINSMRECGINKIAINKMCIDNPYKLFLE
jgi:predicted metal-dependent TIM-barrel fold hydrolase